MSTDTINDLIPLLDSVDALPGAAQLRNRSYELLGLEPGDRVVDVGCGAGRAVGELADRAVHATGVDLSESMVAVARGRRPDAEFRIGDACDLPLSDGEVDGYRAEKVLHALRDPGRAISEARRVLRSDGRIVLIGQDWDTFVIDSTDPDLTRAIVRGAADAVAGPRTARRYRNLLLDAGFRDVEIEVHTGVFTDETMLPVLAGLAEAARSVGAISAEQAEMWITKQSAAARSNRLFLAVPLFVASATSRP